MEEELKLGRAAYAAGDFEQAVEHFTDVLEDVDCDQESLHLVHSNRCACYLQLKLGDKAFDDAEACTSYKPSWPKGWARLGAALDLKGRLEEAVAAFEKAAELDPKNAAAYTEDADRLKLRIEARDAGKRARAKYQERSFGTAANHGRPAPWTAAHPLLENAQLALRGVVLVNAVFYLCTFSTDRALLRSRYRSLLVRVLASGLLYAFRKHGPPHLAKDYAQACMSDVAVQQRVFGAVFVLMGASLGAGLPLLYCELADFLATCVKKLRARGRKKVALSVVAAVEGALLNGDGVVDWRIAWNAAYAEVAAGCLLFLEMLTPKRNLLFLMMYWQYLQMRYMLEAAAPALATSMTGAAATTADQVGALHNAFDHLDKKATALLAAPAAPAFLASLYGRLKAFLQRQVKLPEPGQKPTTTCTLM